MLWLELSIEHYVTKIAIELGTRRKNRKSRHNRGWSSLLPSDAMSKTTKHDGKWQNNIRENMVHLYAPSSWIWLDGQSPFWPTGLNMGPQSRNTRRGLQTNYGSPRLYYCKIWTQTQFMNDSTYVSRTHANAFKHSHSWTYSENARLRALGEGCIHEYIVHYMHLVCICASWEPEDRFHKDTSADWMGARQSLSQCMEGLYWFCSVHIAGMIIIGLNGLLFK